MSEQLMWAENVIRAMENGRHDEVSRLSKIKYHIVRTSVERPFRNCCGFFLCNCFLLFITIAVVVATTGQLITEAGNKDWYPAERKIARESDAFEAAQTMVVESDQAEIGGEAASRVNFLTLHTLTFFIEWESENGQDILNAANVQTVCQLEATVTKQPHFENVCWKGTVEMIKAKKASGSSIFPGYIKGTDCAIAPGSLAEVFYGNTLDYACELLDDATFNAAKADMYSKAKSTDPKDSALVSKYGFFLDKSFGRSGKTQTTRALLQLGSPLDGFKSKDDGTDAQRKQYAKLWEAVDKSLADFFGYTWPSIFFRSKLYESMSHNGLRVRWHGIGIQQIEFLRVVNQDMNWVLGAMFFVWIWLTVHSRSLLIGTISMGQIFMAIPTALFFFRVILGIEYYTQLHMCVIFLACGVGADDVFVMLDAYEETKTEILLIQKYSRPLRKEEYMMALLKALNRSYKAVFNTSFTTTAAFLATAISPIMPISGFGIYAAITICCLYIFAMICTPSVLYMADTSFEEGGCCLCKSDPCCRCCEKNWCPCWRKYKPSFANAPMVDAPVKIAITAEGHQTEGQQKTIDGVNPVSKPSKDSAAEPASDARLFVLYFHFLTKYRLLIRRCECAKKRGGSKADSSVASRGASSGSEALEPMSKIQRNPPMFQFLVSDWIATEKDCEAEQLTEEAEEKRANIESRRRSRSKDHSKDEQQSERVSMEKAQIAPDMPGTIQELPAKDSIQPEQSVAQLGLQPKSSKTSGQSQSQEESQQPSKTSESLKMMVEAEHNGEIPMDLPEGVSDNFSKYTFEKSTAKESRKAGKNSEKALQTKSGSDKSTCVAHSMVQVEGNHFMGEEFDDPEVIKTISRGSATPTSVATEAWKELPDIHGWGLLARSVAADAEGSTAVRSIRSFTSSVTLDQKHLRVAKWRNSKYFTIHLVPAFLILSLSAWAMYALSQALQLVAPVEQEIWFKDGHMYNKFRQFMSENFLSSATTQYVEVYITWGIAGVDRDGFTRWVPNENRGKPIFRSINVYEGLPTLNAVCDYVENAPCTARGCNPVVIGGSKTLTNPGTHLCITDEFIRWANTTSVGYKSKLVSSDQFLASLKSFRKNEVPGQNLASSDPEATHGKQDWKLYAGFIYGELKYITISHRSTLKFLQPNKVRGSVYDRYEALMGELPYSHHLGDPIHTTDFDWGWYDVEQQLIATLFTGLALCFPVSYCVLLLATQNVYVATYAILAIAQIVSMVMGIFKYGFDWHLGIAESVAGVIVIGFAIDYSLHMGHMFMEAAECGVFGRMSKTKYALEKMGITILAGAITTAGAGAFMLVCQMLFFSKMAIMIVITIFFSLLYTVCWFLPMMLLFGPKYQGGTISPYLEKVSEKCLPVSDKL